MERLDKYKSNLVWIDLEMTGLDPAIDTILEIATVVTDNDLKIIAQGPSLVIKQDESVLQNMNDWCKIQHGKSGLCDAVRASEITLEEAEELTLAFLKQHAQENMSPLCGNSVWNDRLFLTKYMPRITNFLHYRLIDVSSIKEVVSRWYPNNPLTSFKKSDNHRAEEDILASIKELEHYRRTFFVSDGE